MKFHNLFEIFSVIIIKNKILLISKMIFKMKLWKTLTVIASIGAIIQFFKWALDSLAG